MFTEFKEVVIKGKNRNKKRGESKTSPLFNNLK